jgi:hypothetical protein
LRIINKNNYHHKQNLCILKERKKVLSVIKRIRESFHGSEYIYTQASCVRFAMILREIFPEGEVLYNSDHAIFELHDTCYDIRGIAYKDNHIPLSQHGYIQIKDVLSQRASIVVKY